MLQKYLEIKLKKKIVKHDNKKIKYYYNNNNFSPYHEIPYLNDKIHGDELWFWEDGTLWGKIPHKNNIQHGIENGDLKIKRIKYKGKKEGITIYY